MEPRKFTQEFKVEEVKLIQERAKVGVEKLGSGLNTVRLVLSRSP